MLDAMFTDGGAWFAVPALLGSGVFLIRIVLLLAGMHHDGGLEAHADPIDAHHPDSTAVAKVLSVQTVSAFIMGFGWGGLGALRGMAWDMASSVFVGVAAGVAMVWLLVRLLGAVRSLQSTGNVPIDAALGGTGEVYVSVPGAGAGQGQVRVVVHGTARIYNAISQGEALATGAPVRVVRVNGDNTLTVARA